MVLFEAALDTEAHVGKLALQTRMTAWIGPVACLYKMTI